MIEHDLYQTIIALIERLYILSYHTQMAHWHVKGLNFSALHELFGEHYHLLLKEIDELAEQLRFHHFSLPAKLSALLQSQEPAFPFDTAQSQIQHLIEQHQEVIKNIDLLIEQSTYKNRYSLADILTEMLRNHEKILWFYHSSL